MNTDKKGHQENSYLCFTSFICGEIVDMFTGIIEELGRVKSVERRGDGVRIRIAAKIVSNGTQEGDSIAVNGVCLTALDTIWLR